MKRHITIIMLMLLPIILLGGCTSGKEAKPKNETINTSTTSTSEKDNSSNDAITKSENSTSDEQIQELKRKQEFLDSEQGHNLQVAAWKFTMAYFCGDVNTMKSYLVDAQNKSHDYNSENIFNNVEFLIFKISGKDIKKDKVIAEYEFGLKGDDTYQYMNLEFKKINGEWKIESFGLEK